MRAMVERDGVMKQVAEDLGIALKTVETLYGRACDKIGGRTRTGSLLIWDRQHHCDRTHWQQCEHCAGVGFVRRVA